jgi:hypothetical protein
MNYVNIVGKFTPIMNYARIVEIFGKTPILASFFFFKKK